MERQTAHGSTCLYRSKSISVPLSLYIYLCACVGIDVYVRIHFMDICVHAFLLWPWKILVLLLLWLTARVKGKFVHLHAWDATPLRKTMCRCGCISFSFWCPLQGTERSAWNRLYTRRASYRRTSGAWVSESTSLSKYAHVCLSHFLFCQKHHSHALCIRVHNHVYLPISSSGSSYLASDQSVYTSYACRLNHGMSVCSFFFS